MDHATEAVNKAIAKYQRFLRSKKIRPICEYHPADHDADRLLTRERDPEYYSIQKRAREYALPQD